MPTPLPDPTARRAIVPFALARLAAGLARGASRLSGRGGTALPGKVLLALNPGGLRKLRRKVRNAHVVLVSATNGKTTLTAMLAAVVHAAGEQAVHNVTGANLRSGVASTLLRARRGARVVLLEVDEAALPSVARDLRPGTILLGNLFRDQLDRYGELETLTDRWSSMLADLPAGTTVVYNADDPLIATLVADANGDGRLQTIAFGMEDPDVAAAALPHAADARFCRRCGASLDYGHSWVGHLGDYACPSCGFARPELDVAATQVTLEGLGATRVHVRTPAGIHGFEARVRIPGLYNAYNVLGAVAVSHALHLPAAAVTEGIAAFSPAFGRFERVPVPGGGSLTLLLVKNPTALNEVVRTLVDASVDLTACLFALNDGIADGRDVSWIWDADLEPLFEAAPAFIATGDRAAELALRAAYAGADPRSITVEPDIEEALAIVLERARDFTEHRHAYALVTYTAMLRLRAVIRERGWVNAFWDEQERTRSVVVAP